MTAESRSAEDKLTFKTKEGVLEKTQLALGKTVFR